MFSHSSRLRRSFSATASFQSPSIKSLSEDLYKERDLRSLVEKFKRYSSSDRFRNKAGIYETTVRRLASAKRFRWIQEILEHQNVFRHDVSKENFNIRLIKLYGQSAMFDCAKRVFDEMPERNCERTVKSVNALLSACVNAGKYDEIEGTFEEMEMKWKVKPDVVSYNIVIKGLCEMGKLDRGLALFDAMLRKSGVNPDLITFNTLLNGLYENKRFDEGENMWKRMVKCNLIPNIRSYNARLVGLVNEKEFEEAGKLITEMAQNGIKPDLFTYAALIRGYCNEGNVNEVKKWYSEMVRCDCVPDRALVGVVLSCACDHGDYNWCFELCNELFERKCLVDSGVLQKVVDSLLKVSRIAEAKKIVQMGKTNDYCLYKLKLE
ncbi:pentatricopeptide repeat-containing protein mitochondrial-like [Dorcoceras hygrometricum]|uniref:Pentatricopeptide repeat-containing protein mitochondrial-like n=1 Tax=Dorcoceras hygrometricum TaxID=472368 RepID=A0A2Z7B0K6_9LAMI|nr:pentatricopeptide repeat-containing protein mitochondrial-like [Dorcoceras hygrometricum]